MFVHALEKHAQHVPAIFDWDDLILPSEQKGLLRQAVDRVRYRCVVLEMKHLVVALSQEQKKLGRVIINNDFGDYAYLLKY